MGYSSGHLHHPEWRQNLGWREIVSWLPISSMEYKEVNDINEG